MKCIALFATFVVAALAEADPEPFYGYGGYGYALGYGGIGLHGARYAGAYGVAPMTSRTYISSSPVITKRVITPVASAVPARTYISSAPVIAKKVITPVSSVAPVVPAVAPAVTQYVSTTNVRAVPSAPSTSQFHKQDELGNYEYGYDNVNSAKKETGNARVGVTGSYTVKDLQGPRTINYVADALGFRATNSFGRKKRSAEADAWYPYGGILGSYPFRSYTNAFASPVTYSAVTPVASPVPAVTTNAVPVSTSVLKAVPSAPSTSQHHRQDEFGNFDYGYQNIHSSKQESGNARTGVTGGYTYRDAFGIQRTINYVADGFGFRATAPTLLRHKRNVAFAPSGVDTRTANMMTIHNNPGYAVSYQVLPFA